MANAKRFPFFWCLTRDTEVFTEMSYLGNLYQATFQYQQGIVHDKRRTYLDDQSRGATLGHIYLQSVKRIEVLKGPASVPYGSNAYVGAINVVLNEATQDRDDYA